MTLATGKWGKYRYYKCQSRIAKGNHACDSPNLPMQKVDELVLKALADKVLTPIRLKSMIAEAKKYLRNSHSEHDEQLKRLTKELSDLKLRSDRLFEAVENGFLPMDSALQSRAQKLQARRQELLLEIAGFKRQAETPLKRLSGNQVEAFGKALKARLAENGSFAKQYLRLLVTRIRVTRNKLEMQGSYDALANAIGQSTHGAIAMVPSFAPSWLPE